jgi:hypothetical protein
MAAGNQSHAVLRVGTPRRIDAALALGAALLVLAAPHRVLAALPDCTASITDCCQITTSGTYALTSDINTTNSGDCISVQAPDVVLSGGGADFMLNTSPSPAGTAIHVLSGAARFFMDLRGVGVIFGFQTGVLNDASDTLIADTKVDSCGGNGFVNNGAQATYVSIAGFSNGGDGFVNNGAAGLRLTQFDLDTNGGNGITLNATSGAIMFGGTANGNKVTGLLIDGSGGNLISLQASSNADGVWIKGSSNNFLSSFGFTNSGAAVYVGCDPSGLPKGVTTCTSPGSGNSILGDGSLGFGAIPNAYAVAIDIGENGDQVAEVGANTSTVEDATDENANCGTNLWTNNQFGTTSQACIH